MPKFISFDYDLEQGYSLALIDFLELNKNNIPKGFDYDVHSTNKHGVIEIKERMDKLLNQVSQWDY